MKKIIITLVFELIVIVSCNSRSELSVYNSALGINQNVKSMKVMVYSASNKFGELVKGRLNECYVYDFNDSKQLISITKYDDDGELDNKDTYEYNNNGELICNKSFYNSHGLVKFYSYETYEYDENSNLITNLYFDDDDKLCRTRTYDYDELNRVVISKYRDVSNEDESKYDYDLLYHYTDTTVCATYHQIKTQSQKDTTWTFETNYPNPKSNIILDRINFDSLDEDDVITYDKRGNWIKIVKYFDDYNPFEIIERSIEY